MPPLQHVAVVVDALETVVKRVKLPALVDVKIVVTQLANLLAQADAKRDAIRHALVRVKEDDRIVAIQHAPLVVEDIVTEDVILRVKLPALENVKQLATKVATVHAKRDAPMIARQDVMRHVLDRVLQLVREGLNNG